MDRYSGTERAITESCGPPQEKGAMENMERSCSPCFCRKRIIFFLVYTCVLVECFDGSIHKFIFLVVILMECNSNGIRF